MTVNGAYNKAASFTGAVCAYNALLGIDTSTTCGGGEQSFTFRRSSKVCGLGKGIDDGLGWQVVLVLTSMGTVQQTCKSICSTLFLSLGTLPTDEALKLHCGRASIMAWGVWVLHWA